MRDEEEREDEEMVKAEEEEEEYEETEGEAGREGGREASCTNFERTDDIENKTKKIWS